MAKNISRAKAKEPIARRGRVGPSTIGDNAAGGQARVKLTHSGLKDVGGSEDASFNFWLLKATMSVRNETRWLGDSDKSQQVTAVVQALRGFAPMDEVEGMMAAQAVALHMGAMHCFRLAATPEQSFEVGQGMRKQGANLSRAYIELVAALDRRRGKGVQQIFRVERVQIAAGGQAIVGNVMAEAHPRSATEGVGYVEQTEGEPDASPARLAHDASVGAVLPALRSESADDWEAVSLTRDE